MRVEYKKNEGRWRWQLFADDAVVAFSSSVIFFRFKFQCRRHFKKRYAMLRKKRQHWPKYRDLDKKGVTTDG